MGDACLLTRTKKFQECLFCCTSWAQPWLEVGFRVFLALVNKRYIKNFIFSVSEHELVTSFLHLSGGFDVPVLCNDCMENGNSYSRPSDYLCQGITPPSGMEYQQIQPPSTFSGHKMSDGHCIGTPNGVRREATPTAHKKQGDRKGEGEKTSSRA